MVGFLLGLALKLGLELRESSAVVGWGAAIHKVQVSCPFLLLSGLQI